MSRRPVLGLDIDGVVYDFWTSARDVILRIFGLAIPTDWPEWDGPKTYLRALGRADIWDWLWSREAALNGLYHLGNPYIGALDAVRRLSRKHDVVALTSRPSFAAPQTLGWVSTALPTLSGVVVLGDRPKSSVTCDIYIDDAPHHVRDLDIDTSARVLLVDRPWNTCVTDPSITRVPNDWSFVDQEGDLTC
jgi:uncharacterized HAD superfamily protein